MKGRIQLTGDEVKWAIQEYLRNRIHGKTRISRIAVNAQGATVTLDHRPPRQSRRREIDADFEDD